MRWLWIVPIVLSVLFDGAGQSRKWSVGVYTILATFFFAGTIVWIVPHHASVPGIILATLFLWGPANLLLALAVEKASRRLFRSFRIWGSTSSNGTTTTHAVLAAAFIVGVLGLAAAFPFAYRGAVFAATPGPPTSSE